MVYLVKKGVVELVRKDNKVSRNQVDQQLEFKLDVQSNQQNNDHVDIGQSQTNRWCPIYSNGC